MSAPRSARVADFDGAAATAIKHAQEGEETVITSNGEEVARIVPGTPGHIRLPSGVTIRLPTRPRSRIGLRENKIELNGESIVDTVLRERR